MIRIILSIRFYGHCVSFYATMFSINHQTPPRGHRNQKPDQLLQKRRFIFLMISILWNMISYSFFNQKKTEVFLFQTLSILCWYDLLFRRYRRSNLSVILIFSVLLASSHGWTSLSLSLSLCLSWEHWPISSLTSAHWSATDADSTFFLLSLRNVRTSGKESRSRRIVPPFMLVLNGERYTLNPCIFQVNRDIDSRQSVFQRACLSLAIGSIGFGKIDYRTFGEDNVGLKSLSSFWTKYTTLYIFVRSEYNITLLLCIIIMSEETIFEYYKYIFPQL